LNSQADQRFLPFLEKVFYTVGVGTVWEDYENIGKKTSPVEFQRKVEASDAIFLVLSLGAQASVRDQDLSFLNSPFAQGKDVYVFEHCEDLKRISIQVPRVNHYFALYITNAWTDEVVKTAETFEGSKPLPAPYPDATLKLLSTAAVWISFAEGSGISLFDFSTSRPIGRKTTCPNCAAVYNLHLPADMKIVRCPACGQFSEIKVEDKAGALPAPAA
jgi:predicted Zn finger-like uncharacterized protein